ncbi:hypothetical protein KKC1_23000 [Calderihabitans maritimus]|uniref:Uncharacterized protein n=1 Tax=Calderihabitans maritimus TaxID=1246530 RepID=A0A1Z5HUE5_9FIRM|nr:hypothetical protein KKC1_23000 [Calderihabitans maritimus]
MIANLREEPMVVPSLLCILVSGFGKEQFYVRYIEKLA